MIDRAKWWYVLDGFIRSWRQQRVCPSCGSRESHSVDRKGFHQLLRCDGCGLLYRWPYETQEEMQRFYQRAYQQAGLTTDLPDAATLKTLLQNGFRGSSKDFSRVVELLLVLSIKPGARILDFGANWGYGVWQFREAGFDAMGYELSQPRAAYSAHLGVEVLTDWSQVVQRSPFDVVFSSHVLEHTPDPAEALRRQREVLAPGGLVIAYVPNGSSHFIEADPSAFHKLWGRVHPVMLDEVFFRKALSPMPVAVGAHQSDDLQGLANWNRKMFWTGTLNTSELLMVAAG